MSKIETVNAFSAALERRDFEKAASYLSNDFALSGPTPEAVGKNEFIGIQSALMQAIPDWSFNVHNVQEQGEKVTEAVQVTGIHTQELVIPGMPPIPATGKKISLPEEHLEFTFKGDKIVSVTSDNVPGTGVPGVLQQIGVQVPM